MASYAADTKVPVSRTRDEIERTLTRFGASAFAYGWQGDDRAIIEFATHDRRVRFELPLPSRGERRFTHTATGQRRASAAIEKEWEQGVRQRWRALLLTIKAKLEAIESGIETFEQAFLAWVVLPDGRTVAEHTGPAIEAAYSTGSVPPMLRLSPGSAPLALGPGDDR